MRKKGRCKKGWERSTSEGCSESKRSSPKEMDPCLGGARRSVKKPEAEVGLT